MTTTREAVIQWLAENHRTQTWLAEKCGVKDQAVSNWLREKNPRTISASAQIIIQRLMEEDAAKSQAKPPHNLVLEFNDEDYALVEKAALGKVVSIREWAKQILNDVASMSDAEFFETFTSRKTVPFPTKANIQAAAGSPISAEVMDWDGGDDTIQVKINGLSMSPKLDDGQIITMRLKRVARNPYMKKGLIYLVEYDGGYTVKIYNTRKATADEIGEEWVENGKVKILESINPEYPEIVIKQPIEWIAWLDEKQNGRPDE